MSDWLRRWTAILHTFTACSRVESAWEYLLYTASRLLGGPVPDADLLFLKFLISTSEIHVLFAVLTFVNLVWSSSGEPVAISPLAVRAPLACPHPPFKSIFKLV